MKNNKIFNSNVNYLDNSDFVLSNSKLEIYISFGMLWIITQCIFCASLILMDYLENWWTMTFAVVSGITSLLTLYKSIKDSKTYFKYVSK